MLKDAKIKVKQVHGAECNIVFVVVGSFFCSISIFFNVNPFSTNVRFMQKAGSWFLLAKMFKKQLWKSDILSKDAGHRPGSLLKISLFPSEHLRWRALQRYLTALLANYCYKALHRRCLRRSWL